MSFDKGTIARWGVAGLAALGVANGVGYISGKGYSAVDMGFSGSELASLVRDPVLCEIVVAMRDCEQHDCVNYRKTCLALEVFCKGRDEGSVPRMVVAYRRVKLVMGRMQKSVPAWDVRTTKRMEEFVPELESLLEDEISSSRLVS